MYKHGVKASTTKRTNCDIDYLRDLLRRTRYYLNDDGQPQCADPHCPDCLANKLVREIDEVLK